MSMGGCGDWIYRTCMCCLSEDEKTAIAVDKEIKRILRQQKKKERREIKILLLGEYSNAAPEFKHVMAQNQSAKA